MGMTTKISMKVSKLDSRHTGNQWFTHRVSFDGHHQGCIQGLCSAREWLWTTFGPSREVGSIGYMDPTQRPVWAWETNYNYFRIYLTGPALTQFLLIQDHFK